MYIVGSIVFLVSWGEEVSEKKRTVRCAATNTARPFFNALVQKFARFSNPQYQRMSGRAE
jgi:hypothetical protein